MKKLLALFVMAIGACGMMMAAWVPDDYASIKLDKEGADGQVQMKTLRTDEGKIILTWLRGERKDYFAYELHLQVFDEDGNAMFGDEGIIVSDKPTRTWNTDYGLALAPNGDIIMAYTDIRNDMEYEEETEVYLYRYSQDGEPVWDPDGVLFPSWNANPNTFSAEDENPAVCVSGDNIYAAIVRNEYFGGMQSVWEMVRFNDDGTVNPNFKKTLNCRVLTMNPAPNGYVYCVYNNSNRGYDADMLDEDLISVWGEPVTIESRPISNGYYYPTPLTAVNEDDVLMLSYRVLTDFYGFQVVNYVDPEGNFAAEAISCNNSIDGNAGSAQMGVKENRAMVAWEWAYSSSANYINVNVIDDYDNFFWTGDLEYGLSLDMNSDWGFTPVKVIPVYDGWVVLYGNSTSWNGANFMVTMIDEAGLVVWTKQICEDNFKSSGFSVVYDENNAYIFYTQETQYDDNWNEIPGSSGMYVMCVDIKGEQPSTSIDEVKKAEVVKTEIYTLDGRQVSEMQEGVNIVRTTDADGNQTSIKVLK